VGCFARGLISCPSPPSLFGREMKISYQYEATNY